MATTSHVWSFVSAATLIIGTASALGSLRQGDARMSLKDLPPPKTFSFRELAPPSNEDDTFSLCTYNVLHQDLISPQRYPTVVDKDLVFDPSRRIKMLRQDLRQLSPISDILCFEEMSPSVYQDFVDELGDAYGSHLVKRQANKPLHNAMFYKKSKLQLIQHYDLNLHRYLSDMPTDLKAFEDLKFHAIANHFIWGNHHLLVVMVHLHHDPSHDLIKYAEMSCLLREVSRIQRDIADQHNCEARILIAGDFNAQPSNQVYRLAALGEPPTLASLEAETMVLPAWLEQRKTWLPLYQRLVNQTPKLQFFSVYGQSQGKGERGHPRYTNLTDGFTNTIDYILFGNHLRPLRLLELDTKLYEKEDFLPSQYHASDHVILWAEFQG